MNNPLPRWWVGLFIITIVFSLIYLAMYPGVGSYKGQLGWSAVGQHQAEVDKGNKETEPFVHQVQGHEARGCGQGSPGYGHWRTYFHEQLFAVSRF